MDEVGWRTAATAALVVAVRDGEEYRAGPLGPDGLTLRAYRCRHRVSRELTGGVQVEVEVAPPAYGPAARLSGRLPPGWTEGQLVRRAGHLLDLGERRARLDRARDAVLARLSALTPSPALRDLILETAARERLPLDVAHCTEDQCAAWLAALPR